MTARTPPAASPPQDPTALVEAAKIQHQANELDAAAENYSRALALAPDQIEALYLFGALNYQRGRYAEAATLLERCLALAPDHIPATEALVESLIQTSRGALDGATLRALVARFPEYLGVRVRLCAALAREGQWQDCEAAARACLALEPGQPEALYYLATSLRAQRRWPDAARAYGDALAVHPGYAPSHDEYGAVLFELGRYDAAEREIRAAIALAPATPEPHTNLGRLLARIPGKAAEALHHHDLCLAARPDYADAHSNRAAALYALNRLDEAETACRRAIALKPSLAEARSNLGNILQRRGDLDGASAAYRAALALEPDFAEAQWNLGLAQLTLGQFEEGWRGFEARWRCRDFVSPDRSLGLPRFDPAHPATGPVLVWGEQGVGDEIVYGGMVNDLAAKGSDVILECDNRLAPLWKRSLPRVTVAGRGDHVAALVRERGATAQIPVASLGAALRKTESAFPRHRGYLHADAARRDDLRKRLSPHGQPLIALSWLSRNDELGAGKSASLENWQPILSAPGVRFVNAQYGDTAHDRRSSGAEIGDAGIDLFNDLDGVAALLAACDLVITVSNTTAHLAGALGVPVWVLAPAGVGKLWYWFAQRSDTPWYPSARLYRQKVAGAWDEPIAAIAQHLAGLAVRR